MKKLTSCVLAVIFLLSTPYISIAYEKEINNLSSSMAKKIADSGKKTIAVVDFTNLQGNVSELGRFIAEEFSTALVDTGKGFEVVDRIHLKSILKEHKLSMSGLIDPTTARKLGKIAGVDAILTGTITPFGDEVRLSVKVLATDTAKIICASRGNIPKTKAIGDLINRGIVKGTQQDTSTIPPEKPYIAMKKVEANNFTFELEKCKRSGTNVTCDLLITNNNDEDIEVNIIGSHAAYGYSRIIDDLGNEYKANLAKIGKNKNDSRVSTCFVQGVPTRAVLYFEGVSSELKYLSLLEVECATVINLKHFRAQLRNVQLSK